MGADPGWVCLSLQTLRHAMQRSPLQQGGPHEPGSPLQPGRPALRHVMQHGLGLLARGRPALPHVMQCSPLAPGKAPVCQALHAASQGLAPKGQRRGTNPLGGIIGALCCNNNKVRALCVRCHLLYCYLAKSIMIATIKLLDGIFPCDKLGISLRIRSCLLYTSTYCSHHFTIKCS
jgi:hypothetical protein